MTIPIPRSVHPAAADPHRLDEAAAMWDLLASLDVLAAMPPRGLRAYARTVTSGWPRRRARAFVAALRMLLRVRNEFGRVETRPMDGIAALH